MVRLRVTWIVRHLSAGTHLGVLATAAGLEPAQIVRYARFASGPSSDEAHQMLREAEAL
jgi:hypothetical protein